MDNKDSKRYYYDRRRGIWQTEESTKPDFTHPVIPLSDELKKQWESKKSGYVYLEKDFELQYEVKEAGKPGAWTICHEKIYRYAEQNGFEKQVIAIEQG